MKSFFQIFIFILIIIIGFFFYKVYFTENQEDLNKKIEIKKLDQLSKNSKNIQNNIIKNLKYEVNFIDSGDYKLTADLSEIVYKENYETLLMQNVVATFTDKQNVEIIIKSDEAIFDKSTYNTKFKKNVKIEYLENTILSDKLDIDFKENVVTIYENIIYNGVKGALVADNIKINIITKNIEIFMNNPKNKVQIISK